MQKLKLLKREKLLFLTPFLFLIVPILAHWRQDRLDKAQIRLAGANAINCGVGHSATVENNVVTKDRAVVDACAVAAFTQKKPFRARFNETTDRDETISTGVAGNSQGQIFFFYYAYKSGWIKRELDYQQALCKKPIAIHQAVRCRPCSDLDYAGCLWGR